MAINWLKPDEHVSVYFTVKEVLWLPSWSRLGAVKDGFGPEQVVNAVNLAKTMDKVRAFLGKPVTVHVWFRSKSYNKEIGGAPNSTHIQGQAVDFHVDGYTCDQVRAKLEPKLEEWGLRMERLNGSSWVHLDSRPVAPGGNRYFKP